MKKNLNISYLNGAEGLHKRGGASSGSSGSSGDNVIYYELRDGIITGSDDYNVIISIAASIKILLQKGKFVYGLLWKNAEVANDANYLKAIAFMPQDITITFDGQDKQFHFLDFETLCEATNYPFEEKVKRRITAEEYWAD